MINARRAQGATCGSYGYFPPTAAVVWNTNLIAAATAHSIDMQKNEVGHYGSDGRDPGQRMIAAGYDLSWWGENLATGQGSVKEAIDWWMGSPGHCANIMNPVFKDVGMACVNGTSSNTWRTYFTLDLAAPR